MKVCKSCGAMNEDDKRKCVVCSRSDFAEPRYTADQDAEFLLAIARGMQDGQVAGWNRAKRLEEIAARLRTSGEDVHIMEGLI